jgi:hypothetical protein
MILIDTNDNIDNNDNYGQLVLSFSSPVEMSTTIPKQVLLGIQSSPGFSAASVSGEFVPKRQKEVPLVISLCLVA